MYPVRKTFASQVEASKLDLCGGGATDVVSQGRMDAPSEVYEGKSYSAHNSIIDKREQEIVNIYYINENK